MVDKDLFERETSRNSIESVKASVRISICGSILIFVSGLAVADELLPKATTHHTISSSVADFAVISLPPSPPSLQRKAPKLPTPFRAMAATTSYSHGDPTAEEQLMLEMINRARANPAAEGQRLASTTDTNVLSAYSYFGVDLNKLKNDFNGYPTRPPLAFNPNLIQSARLHSQDMAAHNFQSHTGSNGLTFDQRINNAGYTGWSSIAENIYAYASSVFYGHAGFNVDWGVSSLGHRQNIMNFQPNSSIYREVGIGIVPETNSATQVGPLVITQDFGRRSATFVVGVVYRDTNGDGFYSVGEGVGGVTVATSQGAYYAVTSSSGGYAIPLSQTTGNLTVTASGGGFASPINKTTILNSENVKLDFVLTQTSNQSTKGDFSGDGKADIVGLTATGAIYYSTNLGSWYTVPGALAQIAAGDLNGDGKADIVGLTATGAIYYSTNLGSWYTVPGTLAKLGKTN